MTLETGLAWGVGLFVMIAMTDIPATATFAAALAWLIFVAVLMTYGPKAFGTITSVYASPRVGHPTPATSSHP